MFCVIYIFTGVELARAHTGPTEEIERSLSWCIYFLYVFEWGAFTRACSDVCAQNFVIMGNRKRIRCNCYKSVGVGKSRRVVLAFRFHRGRNFFGTCLSCGWLRTSSVTLFRYTSSLLNLRTL